MPPLYTALLFLSQFVLTILIIALLLRFFLRLSGASTHNSITKWVIKITKPIVKPVQWFLPTWRRLDIAVIIVCLIVEMAKIYIYGFLKVGIEFPILPIFVFSCGQLLQFALQLYGIAVIAQAVLSWINPDPNPLTDIVYTLTAPLLNFTRRFIPPLGGFDLSPVAVWIALQFVNIFVAAPIMQHSLWMIY